MIGRARRPPARLWPARCPRPAASRLANFRRAGLPAVCCSAAARPGTTARPARTPGPSRPRQEEGAGRPLRQRWRRVAAGGRAERVNVPDFPADAAGKAIPYGVYDLGANAGWVSVGTDHPPLVGAGRSGGLPACDPAAGDRGCWRVQRLSGPSVEDAAGTVGGRDGPCGHGVHFPPGTSKWNRVEHRLFSYISMNWRGRPLVSHAVILELIAATRTRSGLRAHAELDLGRYPLGVKVPTGSWLRCRCGGTTGTGSETPPCSPPPRNHSDGPASNLVVRDPSQWIGRQPTTACAATSFTLNPSEHFSDAR
jgi:hypothetical protein